MKTFIKFRGYFDGGVDKRYGIAVIEGNQVLEFINESDFAEKYPQEEAKKGSAFVLIIEEFPRAPTFCTLFNRFYYKDRDESTAVTPQELGKHKFF